MNELFWLGMNSTCRYESRIYSWENSSSAEVIWVSSSFLSDDSFWSSNIKFLKISFSCSSLDRKTERVFVRIDLDSSKIHDSKSFLSDKRLVFSCILSVFSSLCVKDITYFMIPSPTWWNAKSSASILVNVPMLLAGELQAFLDGWVTTSMSGTYLPLEALALLDKRFRVQSSRWSLSICSQTYSIQLPTCP